MIERQVVSLGVCFGPDSPGEVAAHVEPRVTRVLQVENAGPTADRPFTAGAPSEAHPRRPVRFIVCDQPVAQPPIARDLDSRIEPNASVGVDIPRSDAREGRMVAHVRHVGRMVDII